MKFYYVQFFMLGDPKAHTRILVTDKIESWKKLGDDIGAVLVLEKEITAQEAMRGQKYYKVMIHA